MKDKIIIASGPVIVEDDKVLLNKHGDTAFWKFCGGRVESFDQTLAEAARREVKEEMGLEVEILNDTPCLLYARKTTDEGLVDVILVHFLAHRHGEINPGSDIREWAWLPIDELMKMPEGELAPNILPALKHFKFIV